MLPFNACCFAKWKKYTYEFVQNNTPPHPHSLSAPTTKRVARCSAGINGYEKKGRHPPLLPQFFIFFGGKYHFFSFQTVFQYAFCFVLFSSFCFEETVFFYSPPLAKIATLIEHWQHLLLSIRVYELP